MEKIIKLLSVISINIKRWADSNEKMAKYQKMLLEEYKKIGEHYQSKNEDRKEMIKNSDIDNDEPPIHKTENTEDPI